MSCQLLRIRVSATQVDSEIDLTIHSTRPHNVEVLPRTKPEGRSPQLLLRDGLTFLDFFKRLIRIISCTARALGAANIK